MKKIKRKPASRFTVNGRDLRVYKGEAPPTSVWQVPRNDVEAALACREYLRSINAYGPDEARVLVMLQDDPSALLAALKKLNQQGE